MFTYLDAKKYKATIDSSLALTAADQRTQFSIQTAGFFL
jgi:hypothetical protein